MTDEQIKGIARAINPHWWNDDIDLLNFTRVVLSRERAHDEALLQQALEALESCDAEHPSDGYRQWYDSKAVDAAIAAIKERLK